jgi:hypothetical protein
MKYILKILVILIITKNSYSQDSCEVDVKNKYFELTQGVTLFYHENGVISKKFNKK